MTTLAIDTAAGVSVGLADAGQVIASVHLEESRSHAERLMPLINDMLIKAGRDWDQLSHVVCGMGPGP
ncbi:MAG: tRNA (adenosine(37)-N6)-threonylcarbamoyltransferase complex dimerization subunit type 1 TsaB, partial [Propionibacterium sp.]